MSVAGSSPCSPSGKISTSATSQVGSSDGPRSQKRKRPVNKVHFNEHQNQYYEDTKHNSTSDVDCHQETWYSNYDYKKMRCDMQRVLCEAHQEMFAAPWTCTSFSETLSTLLEHATSVKFVVDDVDRILTKETRQSIKTLYQPHNATERLEWIGLEYQLAKMLMKEAHVRRESIQEIVGDIQAEYHLGLWNQAEYSNELQESCRTFTQAMGLLAQMLAQAQLMVAA